jgi:hypothetical protein
MTDPRMVPRVSSVRVSWLGGTGDVAMVERGHAIVVQTSRGPARSYV